MPTINFDGTPVDVSGTLPAIGEAAPDAFLVKKDLSTLSLSDLRGSRVVLNIFPSIGTGVCQASVRRFNELASSEDDVSVLCVSKDLPFAFFQFCEAEGLENVIPVSVFRDADFGDRYGATILEGPFAGLLSRAVVVLDANGTVVYAEQVPEIGQEPDYDAALAACRL